MEEYYATADKHATYAREDSVLRREAENLGMGYRERKDFSKGLREGGVERRPRFGGRGTTWRGGDPRGLDGDSVLEDDDECGDQSSPEGIAQSEARRRRRRREREEREKAEEEEELANSPLRAKARKAAREISQMYLVGMGRRSAGAGER